jgi:Uma2 family endonuclease
MLIYKNTRIKNYSENMTDEELIEFCALNKELRIERDKHRNIIIMEPVAWSSGYYEQEVMGEIRSWAKSAKKGVSSSSSTGFLLPNGAMRSPDGCWISDERWKRCRRTKRKSSCRWSPILSLRSARPRTASPNYRKRWRNGAKTVPASPG